MAKIAFTLYGRSYCHLCDDMLQALIALCAEQEMLEGRNLDVDADYAIEQIDVDSDPELVALYDELVPVLLGSRMGQVPVRLCHYFLDKQKVNAYLKA
ncbi:glutaredoxin family protein [Glaciimonas immobilis]|uniref:Thiol-disulfide isomerase/thioredoxin n=1 Tax=Glaciimonas immobilis TaxID=728004 RepID=A0A840RQV4_9BURK|nr:glutaredoxin family protein [Glaciimonas immobilis]KAF3997962.1 glutaredoxin family protein [Glaciimonas immobilis]MBB5199368.1 thiol-disulfide isomerase/thioredoxin [Glaciimonas immobilis]